VIILYIVVWSLQCFFPATATPKPTYPIVTLFINSFYVIIMLDNYNNNN